MVNKMTPHGCEKLTIEQRLEIMERRVHRLESALRNREVAIATFENGKMIRNHDDMCLEARINGDVKP